MKNYQFKLFIHEVKKKILFLFFSVQTISAILFYLERISRQKYKMYLLTVIDK